MGIGSKFIISVVFLIINYIFKLLIISVLSVVNGTSFFCHIAVVMVYWAIFAEWFQQ